MKKDIKSFTYEQLEQEMLSLGEKKFRTAQIFSWLHEKDAMSFAEMTNLPVSLRERLSEEYRIPSLEIEQVQVSQEDGTRKYAFRLEDGEVIESVFMRYHHGNSVCISSQVGCRMGCTFCASTLDGLARNLAPSEMLSQIHMIRKDTGERVSHVVVMGTGEPLDNLENLVAFIRLLSDPKADGIGQRNITVSTCGLVPQIDRLAEEKLQITLVLSLHAPEDELRKNMMPIARKYTIRECLDACERYFQRTGRRISFEYALVENVNDSTEHADVLAALLKGKNCHVNLIPVNPIRERSYRRSQPQRVANFKKRLEIHGINVTIRRRLGADIDSACGQLRRKVAKKDENPAKTGAGMRKEGDLT
ncbi:MAG: 23S rRNA (adenine(2503)-C(2))-methyltransferase RlmN [Lachnospiraceae bacterium]|nr:23S rRNA (adenine(2503)-C(2))-methyltransferase RlmN [Lachnospiraceae bacterium]